MQCREGKSYFRHSNDQQYQRITPDYRNGKPTDQLGVVNDEVLDSYNERL